MSAKLLQEGIWSVGVLNPSLRVFDIVMSAPFGTSYNAYLLTGEKNVLIETVHADYFDEYEQNIRQVIPLEQVDYLIMNHNEPDHSGSVAQLLERCPNLTIFSTAAGKKHLEDITNLPVPCKVVKTGDHLDLGNKTLEFISAPMLHWADSMFTWSPTDKTLFTCDFLGAHYCEPTMLDRGIKDIQSYQGEFLNYFQCIFSPFKRFVLEGLSKLPPEAQLICTSHGPCLTAGISQAVENYRNWSTVPTKTSPTACVLYASAYGCTAKLARSAAATLEQSGFQTELADITHRSSAECAALANEADVLLVGAPTINRDAPRAVWDVLASIDAINTRGRAAGAFGAYGWSGEAPKMLHTRLKQLGFTTTETPFQVLFTPTQAQLTEMGHFSSTVSSLLKTT